MRAPTTGARTGAPGPAAGGRPPEVARSDSGSSPAREVAHRVLVRVDARGAFADRALPAEARRAGLDHRQRGQALRLTYGVLQRRLTLDTLADALADRDTLHLPRAPRAALRLGLYELLFSDGTPAHAAVDAAVELAKPAGPRIAGLVNALLRRASREGAEWMDGLSDATAAQAAVRHSHPPWLAEMWFQTLGPDSARALMAADNEPAERAVRANALRITAPDLAVALAAAGVGTNPVPGLAEGLVLDGPFDLAGSELFDNGALMPQSRASMLVARTLAPAAGGRVLDLCAAPGAKTTHLAVLAGADARIDAVERHPGRAQELTRTCVRLGADGVRIHVGEAAAFAACRPGRYDAVLVDPPCTGLGTLRSHPDLRWRVSEDDIARLAAIQLELLNAGAGALVDGGVLLYSTCTVTRPENDGILDALLGAHDELEPAPPDSGLPLWDHAHMPGRLQTVPSRDGTDGFFLARVRRRTGSGPS